MNKLNMLALGVCNTVLIGCASVPMTSELLDTEAKNFTPVTGKANIYVNRGGGIGTAVTVQMLLDGRVTGALAPYTYQLLSVPPGQHVLSTGAGTESVQQQQVNTQAGKNYFFRLSIAMGWAAPRVHLKPLEEEEGRKAIMNSKRAKAVTYYEPHFAAPAATGN